MLKTIEAFLETPAGRFLGMAGLAIAVAILTYIGARAVNRVMQRLVDRQRKSGSSFATFTGFTRYIAVAAVYFAGGMVIVNAIPLLSSAVHTLLTAGGVIAVVAGLAAQEALGSVVSGLMILFFKPFKMGDFVRYVDSDITGTVEEITLHHTAIRTTENKRVIIPNSKMNSAIIENADYADSRVCVFLKVGVSYESDLKKAKQLLAAVVERNPLSLDVRTEQQKKDGAPRVPVVVLELADSAVTLRASLWAKDNATAFTLRCDVLESVKLAYDREGIEIAYPHIEVVTKG